MLQGNQKMKCITLYSEDYNTKDDHLMESED